MGRTDGRERGASSRLAPAIPPERFVAAARFLELYEPVVEHLRHRAAVVAVARREGWAASADELQNEADLFRRALGLHRAQAMTAWLAQVGYSLDEFEEEMEYRLARRRKRAAFTAAELDACFKEQRADLDRARISQVLVAAEPVAREIVAQANAEGADFRELAARHSADETTREAGGYIGWVRRRDLDAEIATRVFAGTPGRCVPPIKLPDGSFLVVLLHERRPAVLDAPTEEELRDALLARWLAHLG